MIITCECVCHIVFLDYCMNEYGNDTDVQKHSINNKGTKLRPQLFLVFFLNWSTLPII